ncbi:flagellar motor protein MotB [Treponema sp.]|uniref:flagellar motor protein MotB n=1 Tax=Treponema sp. TaxID=166 RepID=UPI00298D730C|nr:flagellar motor protein MotB [Treponema sp.]MCQ2242004.1 flagellar motor protein MotB [Treponema sp.]
MAKEKKEPEKPSTAWQGTYGDMITLMLCFFVMLYDPSESDAVQMAALSASLSNNNPGGGISVSPGSLADLGNVVSALPSIEKGKALGPAMKKAISSFAPEVKSNKITITSDERGIIISLASDSFFEEGSADINIEDSRETLLRLSKFFEAPEVAGRRWRIEGHTDNRAVTNGGVFPSNWELSAARAANVLHYLADFGVNEQQFSIAGYADTRPKFSNDTAEGRAYNRRVDVIILDDGHF